MKSSISSSLLLLYCGIPAVGGSDATGSTSNSEEEPNGERLDVTKGSKRFPIKLKKAPQAPKGEAGTKLPKSKGNGPAVGGTKTAGTKLPKSKGTTTNAPKRQRGLSAPSPGIVNHPKKIDANRRRAASYTLQETICVQSGDELDDSYTFMYCGSCAFEGEV